MITMYLRNHTQFFHELSEQFPKFMSDSSWEVFIGAIITRHIGQLVRNFYRVASRIDINNFQCHHNRFAMDMPFPIMRSTILVSSLQRIVSQKENFLCQSKVCGFSQPFFHELACSIIRAIQTFAIGSTTPNYWFTLDALSMKAMKFSTVTDRTAS